MVKRKRKVPASASKAILLEQVSVTYVAAKRLRNQALSALESAKLNAAISNDVSHGWERTSNLRLQQKGKYYYVVLGLREKNNQPKGEGQILKAMHPSKLLKMWPLTSATQLKACWQNKFKEWLDSTLTSLESGSGTTDTAPHVVIADPVLQKITNKFMSTDRRKSFSMTSSLCLRSVHDPPNKNPRNPLSDSFLYEEKASLNANKIQKVVTRRCRKRAEMTLMKTLEEQGCRMTLMITVATILSNSDWKSLLLGGHDPEIVATFSKFDQDHAPDNARHVHEALRTMCLACLQKTVVTWGECCESAVLANFKKYAGRTVMAWCAELHKTKNQIKFWRAPC
jgi:hypothetical protein